MGLKVQQCEVEDATDDGVRKRREVVPSPELGSVGKSISIYKQGALESEAPRKFSDTQKSFQLSLKPQILKLCKILKFSEDAKVLVEEFLDYVLNNHHVGTESKTIVEAFQISLCWTVASMVKQKINHKESVALAKQQLNFKCSKDEADFVHSVLRCLKGLFSYRTGKLKVADSLSSDEQRFISHSGLALEALEIKLVQDGESKSIKEIQKKFQKKLNKLIQKQQKEKDGIVRSFEEDKVHIEERKIMEIAVIRSCLENNSSMRVNKLKSVDISFSKELEELKKQMDTRLKKLEVEQLAARRSIQDREAHWVDAVKSWRARDELLGKRPSSEPDDYVGEVKFRSPQVNSSNDGVIAPVNANPPSSDDCTVEVTLTSPQTNSFYNCVIVPVNVDRPSSEEETCDGLTLNASEKEAQLRVPETIGSSDGLEKLVSGDGPLLEEQIPDTTAPSVSGEVHLGGPETIGSSDGLEKLVSGDGPLLEEQIPDTTAPSVSGEVQLGGPETRGSSDGLENLVSGSGPLLEEEIPKTTAVSVPNNEMQLRVLENVSSGNGDASGLVAQTSLAEKVKDTATLTVAGGEDMLSVPETFCDDVEVTQTSEENDETRIATSKGTTVMNQLDRVDNAVNENSLLQELSQVNASSLQPAIAATNGDPVSANQAREDECTRPSLSCGMQLGDVPPCDEQNVTEGVEHLVSQPVETTPSNQSNHDEIVSEPAAQVYLLMTSDSPSSYNAIGVPLVGEVATLPSSEGCTLNPVTELVANSPLMFNQSVLQLSISSLDLTVDVIIGASGMHFPELRTSVASEFNHRPAQTVPSVPLVAPPLYPDPDILQKELDRLCKEFDQTRKGFEDKKTHLQYECDKEIAQIRLKYEIKQQEVDAESSTKKEEFDGNQKKVCMNVILADAFMSTYLELMPAGRSGSQQDVNAAFLQHLNQPSIQQNTQSPSPVASTPSASSPAATLQTLAPEPNPQITAPAPISVPHTTPLVHGVNPAASLWTSAPEPNRQTTAPAPIIRPHTTPTPLVRGFSPAAASLQTLAPEHNPQTTAPAPIISPRTTPSLVHGVSPSSALFTSAFARPPLIGSVSYSIGNIQASAQIRARPPHLRSSSTTSLPPHPHRMSPLPTNATAPQSNTLPCSPPCFPSSTYQSFPSVGALHPKTSGGLPAHPNIISMQELLRNVDRPHAASSSLADCVPNTGRLNTSEFGTSSVPVNPVSTSGPTDVVDLSDDESP